MGMYIFEVVRGDDHLYLSKGDKLKERYQLKLDPKQRNALAIDSFKRAKGFLDSVMELKPKAFRRLVGLEPTSTRSIVINMRRCSTTPGLADCVAAQRLYVFQEQE